MLANSSVDNDRFYDNAVNRILKKKPDVLGFTSMCLESHVSLEIARKVKLKQPNIKTIFGGTHFGAIAGEVLKNYDFADFVITSEGEHALLSILNKFKSADFALTSNVTYRHKDKIVKGVVESKIFPLEEIPFPAYDLVNLERYFELNPSHLFNYEAGRGCVFKCAFCYSPFHYADNVRNKSPELIVAELKKLVDLGAKHIFFVQDNFLNSPRWASEVCRQIADADLPLTWECYSTYPQLKEQVVELLAKAGCIGIFTGIDAVSISSQKRMNKPFLKSWETTSEKLSSCLKNGILPICAFILEEPNQDLEKIESTIYTALECLRLGCETHLNTLSLYNNTELARNLAKLNYLYSSIKPELLFDTPKIVQNNIFAKESPELFPFHSTYCNIKDWEIFTAKAYVILPLIQGLTRTLYEFVVTKKKSVWQVLEFVDDDFVEWLRNLVPSERHEKVVFEFAKHFALQNLSSQTKELFHSELVGIFLGNRKKSRFVNVLFKGNIFQAELAWFVNLKLFDNLSNDKRIKPFESWNALLDNVLGINQTSQKVAFISKTRKIKIYSVPYELWKILSKFEIASKSQEIINLSQKERDVLEENNWMFLHKTELIPLSVR